MNFKNSAFRVNANIRNRLAPRNFSSENNVKAQQPEVPNQQEKEQPDTFELRKQTKDSALMQILNSSFEKGDIPYDKQQQQKNMSEESQAQNYTMENNPLNYPQDFIQAVDSNKDQLNKLLEKSYYKIDPDELRYQEKLAKGFSQDNKYERFLESFDVIG